MYSNLQFLNRIDRIVLKPPPRACLGEKVWEGHATMMHEIKEQLGETPGGVISCVGRLYE